AEAAYQRALHNFQSGSSEAARRSAVEAVAEDPLHAGARELLKRIEQRAVPIRSLLNNPTAAEQQTSVATSLNDSAPTLPASGPRAAAGPASRTVASSSPAVASSSTLASSETLASSGTAASARTVVSPGTAAPSRGRDHGPTVASRRTAASVPTMAS